LVSAAMVAGIFRDDDKGIFPNNNFMYFQYFLLQYSQLHSKSK